MIDTASNPLDRVAPHTVREDFLPAATLVELLDFALANEARFEASTLRGAKLDATYRASSSLPHDLFRPWRERLRAVLVAALPGLLVELGIAAFPISSIEVELAAHNDGDFYKRHIDTATANRGKHGLRMVSMVQYFHAAPKAFDGGALRLQSFQPGGAFVDIAPANNRLIAFPSWAPHEVMPISCPSRRFRDSRFALNCWAWSNVPRPTAGTTALQS